MILMTNLTWLICDNRLWRDVRLDFCDEETGRWQTDLNDLLDVTIWPIDDLTDDDVTDYDVTDWRDVRLEEQMDMRQTT